MRRNANEIIFLLVRLKKLYVIACFVLAENMADVAIYGQVQIPKRSNSINARPIINADFKMCIYKAIALLRLIH